MWIYLAYFSVIIFMDICIKNFCIFSEWYNPLPVEIIANKEDVCKSVNRATIFDLNEYHIRWLDLRSTNLLTHPKLEFMEDRPTLWMNVLPDRNELYVNLLICKWKTKFPYQGFYLAVPKDFEGYILLRSNHSQTSSLMTVGLVMEFLDLQLIENGHVVFQKIFKDYLKQRCT